MADDNAGPHSPEEIAAIYLNLRQRFPNAEIRATDLTHIADAVQPHADALPLVTQEIGDTWIHGIGSDPLKVARYRAVCRLRNGELTITLEEELLEKMKTSIFGGC